MVQGEVYLKMRDKTTAADVADIAKGAVAALKLSKDELEDRHRERAAEALRNVGLGDRLDHRPNELSGGQPQRLATARALVNHPSLLLADEPTGNLDTETGKEIMLLLETLHRRGNTILLVTHEPPIAHHTRRIVHLRDGKLERDEIVAEPALANTEISLE